MEAGGQRGAGNVLEPKQNETHNMKPSFDNAELPHLWAHQKQSEGHGSHFWFCDSTVYSYALPLARLYKGVVLARIFCEGKYSNTTANHYNLAIAAVNHLDVFQVPNPTRNPCKADVKSYAQRIQKQLIKAARARTQAPITEYNSLIAEANRFCKQFGFKARFTADLSRAPEVLAGIKEAEQKKKKAEERKAKAAQKAAAADLQKWLAGESNSFPSVYHGTVYLRRNKAVVETSKGVRFPFETAVALFPTIAKVRERGIAMENARLVVEGYEISQIDDCGNVTAGCHFVKWEQIEDFAKREGLTI